MSEHSLITVGLNWQTTPVAVREQVAFSESVIPESLRTLKRFSGCLEAMILSTCNRVEVYAATRDAKGCAGFLRDFLASFHDRDDPRFDQYCFDFQEKDTVKHLFRVSAGLDSMVVGENEILHQIKEAYKMASKEGAVGGPLSILAEQAIKVGKEVRQKTKIGQGAVSVASVACELAHKIFGQLNDQRVLILGSGKVGKQALKNMVKDGVGELTIATRNRVVGEELAKMYGAHNVDFSEWLRYLADTDIVICSTGAPHYVVHLQDVKRIMAVRKNKPLFIIDISVPRNVDPEINQLSDVYVYNIDDLKSICDSNLKLRQKEVRACELLIDHRMEHFFLKIEKLKAGPTIEALNQKFDYIAAEEFEKLAKNLPQTPEQQEEMRRLIWNIKNKFLHHPMTKLKEAAEDGGVSRYTEAVHRLFDLDSDEHKPKS